MKSVRITKQMKDDILKSIISQWDKNNPSHDFVKEREKLANYIWKKAFGKYEKTIAELPKEFLRQAYAIKFCHMGEFIELGLDKPLPCNWGNSYNSPVLVNFTKENSKVKKFLQIKDKNIELARNRQEVINEASAVIDSVTTTKQLINAWPQVEPFIPAYISDPKSVRLPAIPVSRLNERLGIKGGK